MMNQKFGGSQKPSWRGGCGLNLLDKARVVIVFAGLAMLGVWPQPADALQPVVVVGYIHCPGAVGVWSGNTFLYCDYSYISNGGGGGGSPVPDGGGGGSGGEGALPSWALPSKSVAKCIVEVYGSHSISGIPVSFSNVWAFRQVLGPHSFGDWVWSFESSTPPAGFSSFNGSSNASPPRIFVFAEGLDGRLGGLSYRDPETHLIESYYDDLDPTEWAAVIIGHEAAHINGGVPQNQDDIAYGYGMKALEMAQADPINPCGL